jgi:hypothetical protein
MTSQNTIVYIEDNRPKEAFKTVTLSNFKRTDVRQALIDSMLRDKIEPATNWTAELLCSGHYADIWEVIFHFMSKYIHLGNPKLPIYVHQRYLWFRDIMNNSIYYNDLDARNDKDIRHIFIEIVCIFTVSLKKNSMEHLKINREEEFDMTKNAERFKAPSLEYAGPIMRSRDPKELSIAINEFNYHLSTKHYRNAVYWVDWIIDFDAICRSRKEPCLCEQRHDVAVDDKFQCDIIWLIWDSILASGSGTDTFREKCVHSLFELFTVRYTNASCKKRRFTIYHAVAVLTEPMDTQIALNGDKDITNIVLSKINTIFAQIKKNEITDAIIAKNEKKQNYENSMKKMKLLSSIEPI